MNIRKRLVGCAIMASLTLLPGSRPILLNRKPAYSGQGLSYDADRRILKLYPSAFGAGVINFTTIFGMRSHGLDAFASAGAFSLEAIETGKDSYFADRPIISKARDGHLASTRSS